MGRIERTANIAQTEPIKFDDIAWNDRKTACCVQFRDSIGLYCHCH